jgi:tetratricopeptide (TPR) repeat protein
VVTPSHTLFRLTLFFLVIGSILKADPFEILDLKPQLFQYQKTAFDKSQSTGILQEYLFKEMDNFKGQYGLHISNLIHYQEVESEMKDLAQTQTLRSRIFNDKSIRIHDEDLLIVKGFYLINNIKEYLDKKEILSSFVSQVKGDSTSPWLKLFLALIQREAKANGLEIGLAEKELATLLSRTSAGKFTDAMFHYSLGHFYLETLKDSNPYRRLRLVTLEFERARTKDPRNRSLFTFLTSLYIEIHEDMQARGIPEPFEFEELVYRRIILIDPKNPWAHNNLSYLYCQNHVELKEALREARIANHLEKDNPYLLDTLGWALYKNKMFEEAARVLKKVLTLDNSLPDAHFHVATVYYDLKEFEKSIKHFKRCIQLDPSSTLAMNNLAYLYSEMNRNLDEGIDLVNRALEGNSKNSAYLDTLGWLYYRKEDYPKALEYLKKAVALAPDSAESQYHLGQVYLKMNQPTTSAEHIQKSMGLKTELGSDEQNLSYAILLQTIQEAKNKYLKMPGVAKTRESMKMFYNQLIFLAQSMGDTSLIQKFAQELEAFPAQDDAPKETLGPSVPKPKKGKREIPSLSAFFPKDADFYLNLKRESLKFLIKRVLSSRQFEIQLQGKNLLSVVQEHLPQQVGFFVGSSDPKARTQVYAVIELDAQRAGTIRENLEKFSQESLVLPWLNQGFILEPLHSGIFQLVGGQVNAFLTVKDRFLVVSNSLLPVKNMPYSKETSLLSNKSLNSTLASTPVSSSDAVLYSGNLPGIEKLIDPKYINLLLKDWVESKDLFQKVQDYISVLHLGKDSFEEYEVISLKTPSDLELIRDLLERKTTAIREALKKDEGIELNSIVTVRDGAVAVHTKVMDIDRFIDHFLHYLDEHKDQIMNMNNNKKKGEPDDK